VCFVDRFYAGQGKAIHQLHETHEITLTCCPMVEPKLVQTKRPPRIVITAIATLMPTPMAMDIQKRLAFST